MIVYVALLEPALAADGSAQTLRYCSHPLASQTDGFSWKPLLRQPYRRNVQLFDGKFQSQPVDSGSLEFALSKGDSREVLTSMVWDGRRVRVWRGSPGQTTSQMTLVFDGVSRDVSGDRRTVRISLRGKDYLLDRPLLSSSYAGTGAAEGPAELKGRLKPLTLGRALNVEPVYVNRALGIFQWHAYGPLDNFYFPDCLAVYDSGSQLGTTTGDHATYAALAAANIPVGRFATCRALGMARHGGEITGVLTADVLGWHRQPDIADYQPDSMMYDLLFSAGGLSAEQIKADSVLWLRSQIPHPVDDYVTEQVSVLEYAQSIMTSLGGYLTSLEDGRVTVGLLRRGGASTVSVDRLNIASLSLRPTSPPVWKRRLGYQKSHRVHSYSEVRTPRELNPRGAWTSAPNPVYQYYDMVSHSGQQWVYVSSAAGSAATPGTDAAVWQYFSTSGADVIESSSQPPSPTVNMLWRNPTNGELRSYVGGSWILLSTVGAKLGTNLTTSGGSTVSDAQALNSFLSIGSNGVFSGGGGGQVTISGLGYTGELNATFGASWGSNLAGRPSNLSSLNGSEFILNAQITIAGSALNGIGSGNGTLVANLGISIGSNGALSGAGGGQVTIGGLGYTGELNADLTLAMQPAAITISKQFTYDNQPKGGIPFDVNIRAVNLANQDVTGGTWSATLKSGSATFSLNSGVPPLNVTGFTANSVVEVSYVYGSKILKTQVTLVQDKDVPPNTGGGGGATSASGSVGQTGVGGSYGTTGAGPILTARPGSSGQVALSSSMEFYRAGPGAGSTIAYGKWQWRVVGGSWADVAAETTSSVSATYTGGSEPENLPGELNVNRTKTGLTAGVDYEFQLLVRTDGSKTCSFNGDEVAVGS